jgi:uncharacterized protein YjbI with pentapeptide repeats
MRGRSLRVEHTLPPINIEPDRWQKAGVIGSIINSFTVLALAVGLGLTYQANRQTAEAAAHQQQLDRQAQISDRFTKAIEQLGSPQIDIRLGGIYGLERLMKDSSADQPTVVEVLSAYVRDHGPAKPSTTNPNVASVSTDVQGALSVLGRRRRPNHEQLGLDFADLSAAHLHGADLHGAGLLDVKLDWADLSDADLRGADLHSAKLNDASLDGADLSDASLSDAELGVTDLRGADLHGADLHGADLNSADLTGANLRGADLSSANLEGAILSERDLTGAFVDKNTVLPLGVTITPAPTTSPS